MADERIGLEVDFESDSTQLQKAALVLEKVSANMAEIGRVAMRTSRQVDKLAASLAGARAQQAAAASAGSGLVAAPAAAAVVSNKVQGPTPLSGVAGYEKMRPHIEAVIRNEKELLAIRQANLANLAAQRAALTAMRAQKFGGFAGNMIPMSPQMAKFNYAQNLIQEFDLANRAVDDHVAKFDRLTNTRYALMGVSFALTGSAAAAGLALYGLARSYMDVESAMARVQRTSGATGQALNGIKNQMIDMAQTVPASFADIDKIATLAGQLNVAAANIGSFTRTAIQFSATTNVTAEASAEAFGRLDELIPGVEGNFEALGSAILNVGINSVATESDIISTANSIAAVAASAGFSAQEVIGFAGAMSSLNIKPELARGGLTRIFGQINNVIATGGLMLDQFAELSGRTADQFASDWKSNAAGVFQDVLSGLNDMTESGEAANVVLAQLGITNSRDIDVMARLAQNTDFLAESMNNAADGYANTTQLSEAFAVQAATLESRIQMMANSFHMLFATIGSGTAGPLGFLAEGLTTILISMQKLANNPIASWTVGLASVVVGLLAVGAALAGIGAIATSAFIAGGTALGHLKKVVIEHYTERLKEVAVVNASAAATARSTIENMRNAGSLRALSANVVSANQVLGGHRSRLGAVVSMLGGPWLLAITGAVAAVGAISVAIQDSQASLQEWEAALNSSSAAIGAFNAAAQGIDLNRMFTGSFDFAAQKAQISDLISEIHRAENEMQMGEFGFPPTLTRDAVQFNNALDEVAAQLAQMDPARAAAFFGDFASQANLSSDSLAQLIDLNDDLRNSLLAYAQMQNANIAGADGIASSHEIASFMLRDAAMAADDAAGAMSVLEESEMGAADAASYFSDSIAQSFSLPTAISDAAGAMYGLAEGLVTSGMSFDYLNASGTVNIANLMKSLETAMVAGQLMGISSADSVAAVFLSLQQMGIDTANLLSQLTAMGVQAIGSVRLSAIGAQMQQARPQVQNYAQQLGNAARAGLAAGRASLSAGRSARDMGDRAQKGARGVRAAAKEVRTLKDYANDLSGVMNRAFEIRFGGVQAQDKVTEGWIKIAEATADAEQEIRDANRAIQETQATMQELTANKAIQEYFLSIAEAYGDTLRADKLSAEIAGLNADMAKEQDNLTDSQAEAAEAQAKLDKSLVGNSKSAIENRQTVLGMVESYEDYLAALAASGASQGELEAKATQLRAEFVRQATQAGFSAAEIGVYAASFDDMALAINRVPRNITVTANTNPALQALAEFQAQAAARATSAGAAAADGFRRGLSAGLGGGGGGGVSIPALTFPDPYPAGVEAGKRFMRGLKTGSNLEGASFLLTRPDGTYENVGQMRAYASGGYTGDINKRDIAGMVHGKEFVVDAANTARLGRPFLDALNSGRTPAMAVPGGNSGVQVVELSAYDRELLRAAGNVQVRIGNQQVATAASAAAITASNRGSN